MALTQTNLIPLDVTLKPGQRLIKIGNTFVPVGIGGNFQPGSGGGGATLFYKCTSVDTTNHVWSGKLLTLRQDGYYDTASTATSGLTYDSTIATVQVGKIYSQDGVIEVAFMPIYTTIPADYSLYIPFDSSTQSTMTAATGQILTQDGTLTFTTQNGIPSCLFGTTACIRAFVDENMSGYEGMQNFTMSFWFYRPTSSVDEKMEIQFKDDSGNYGASCYISDTTIQFNAAYCYQSLPAQMTHIAFVGTGLTSAEIGTVACYINGAYISQATPAGSWNHPPRRNITIHGPSNQSGNGTESYFAAFRFYKRALTANEIASLAHEFTT